MTLIARIILTTGMTVALAQPLMARAEAATNNTPDFKEVYDTIRANLVGESESDLNRAAVEGLLHELHAKVSLQSPAASGNAATGGTTLSRSAVYDNSFGYLRVGKITSDLPAQLSAAYKELSASNELKGIVLDLRFAGGTDYAAAVSVANLFITSERPLLDWGNGVINAKANPDAWSLPLAVLVNEETSAAAEAVAAMLRQDDRAILLGATTAGEAAMSKEFPLKDGQILRIATSAIKLGNGETLSVKGLKPDIAVMVKPEDERTYFADPYKELSSSINVIASIVGEATTNSLNSTNRTARPRPVNEAELMRIRKERPGLELSDIPLPASTDADNDIEKPVVRDPALGRGLDLLKGIAVIRKARSL